jgi:hypothetical protein
MSKLFILYRTEDAHTYDWNPDEVKYRWERRIEKGWYSADDWTWIVVEKDNFVDLDKLSNEYFDRQLKFTIKRKEEQEKKEYERLKKKYN